MFRTGIGYDTHRFKEGRKLILGGVEFDSAVGLDGHSDADVLLHALIDAILGAAAMGDIGSHFPDTDPEFKDADSVELAGEIARRVRSAGYSINNVDATVVAERPKLNPRMDEVRASVARAFDLALNQVSVKATTNERMGFVGKEQGIAVLATALLESSDV